jgi:hypothetical protein
MPLNRSCPPCPGLRELIEPDWGCRVGPELPAFEAPSLLGGRGLFRGSFRVVVDEDGVVIGDWVASLVVFDCDGDEVPSLESPLFLDFEDFGSLARES